MPKESKMVLSGSVSKLEVKATGNKYTLKLRNAGAVINYTNNPVKAGQNTSRALLTSFGKRSSSPLVMRNRSSGKSVI